jgi:hypothetical protein
MAYYRRHYRSWRSRGWRSNSPSKYSMLTGLFGSGVNEIKSCFLSLDTEALNELLADYGDMHGKPAEEYAKKTYSQWKNGTTSLSGQTMERLVTLVPPYLSPEQRFKILSLLLDKHKKKSFYKTIRINIKEPAEGFLELQNLLSSIKYEDVLEHLPETVMEAAKWLYDDDITSARAMLAEAKKTETEIIKQNAFREIGLLKRTISSGQVKSASYSVELPNGNVSVIAYSPSFCFIATACFGQNSSQTLTLRAWRDSYLINKSWGRSFIVWYYNNGEKLSFMTKRSLLLRSFFKALINLVVLIIRKRI